MLTAERALVLTASALARVNYSESAGIYVSAQNHVFFFFFLSQGFCLFLVHLSTEYLLYAYAFMATS